MTKENQLSLFESGDIEVPKSRVKSLAKAEQEHGAEFAIVRNKHYDISRPFTDEMQANFEHYKTPDSRTKTAGDRIMFENRFINGRLGIKSINDVDDLEHIVALVAAKVVVTKTSRECRETGVSKKEFLDTRADRVDHIAAAFGFEKKEKRAA